MTKLKQAAALLLACTVSAGTAAGLTYTPPAIKCAEARHLTTCQECQGITTQVVVGTIEQARKQQGTAPVRSGS